RIHGYENIPEDVIVPMAPSHKSDRDRVMDKIRGALTSVGCDEAVSLSGVSEEASELFSPWNDQPSLRVSCPIIKGADRLRKSLVPSLLQVRRDNEKSGNEIIELFETAKIYLPRNGKLPDEPWMLGVCGGGDFFEVKGIIETVLAELNPHAELEAVPTSHDLLDSEKSAELRLDGKTLGYLGEVSESELAQFGLRKSATVAELRLDVLEQAAVLVPQHQPQSKRPTIDRQLNFVVGEGVRWSDLAACAKEKAGKFLEDLRYVETYRGKGVGEGKKSLLMELVFRGQETNLTNEEVNVDCDRIAQAVQQTLGGELRE
ncbi:MAG: hypothetical protein N2C14_29025, partial [Planctomycetales bacterium]